MGDRTSIVSVGEMAPDHALANYLGVVAQLSSYWAMRPLLLVFMRHFNCPHCRAQTIELRQDREKLHEANVEVVIVGLGTPEQAAQFRTTMAIDFTVVVDPERASYRAFGLMDMNPFRQLTLSGARHWLTDKHNAGGSGVSFDQSMLQRGGTFVIDTLGVLRYVFASPRIAERPPMSAIYEAIAEAHAQAASNRS